MRTLVIPIALLGIGLQSPPGIDLEPGLRDTVTRFWSALQEGDKASALQFVYPDDLNNFLKRQEGGFENWKLERGRAVSETEFRVTVSMDRFLPNGTFSFEVTDRWVRDGENWRIRVDPPVTVAQQIIQAVASASSRELPARLDILPEKLKFYSMAPRQPASIVIRNGLDGPVQMVSVEYDKEKLTLEEWPQQIGPGSTGKIVFRYSGPELQEHNVETVVTLTVSQAGKEQTLEIPALLNYMDNLQRWLGQQQKTGRKPPG